MECERPELQREDKDVKKIISSTDAKMISLVETKVKNFLRISKRIASVWRSQCKLYFTRKGRIWLLWNSLRWYVQVPFKSSSIFTLYAPIRKET